MISFKYGNIRSNVSKNHVATLVWIFVFFVICPRVMAANYIYNEVDAKAAEEYYQAGLDNSISDRKSFSLFEKAANLGHAGALYKLGEAYENGRGVLFKNQSKAFTYYVQSASKGNVNAELKVADAYENGHGVKKNFEEAIMWNSIAASHGSLNAKNWLKSRSIHTSESSRFYSAIEREKESKPKFTCLFQEVA